MVSVLPKNTKIALPVSLCLLACLLFQANIQASAQTFHDMKTPEDEKQLVKMVQVHEASSLEDILPDNMSASVMVSIPSSEEGKATPTAQQVSKTTP